MNEPEIERLVSLVDDGVATAGDLVRLAELLARLEREEPLGVADAVIAEGGAADVSIEVDNAIGAPLLPIAAAVRAAAGPIDVSHQVIATIARNLPLASAVHDELGIAIPIREAVLFEAGRAELAVPVLALLGFEVLPVAEAVRAEAGEIDIADAVMTILTADEGLFASLGPAVAAEAGAVDLADSIMSRIAPKVDGLPEEFVSALLDRALPQDQHVRAAERIAASATLRAEMTSYAEIGRELRVAIAREAGTLPSMWAAIAPRIGIADPEEVVGWDGKRFAEAVRAQAGTVNVTAEVMRRVQRAAIVPTIALEVPEPANSTRWAWGGLAVAAAALFALLVGPQLFSSPTPVEPAPAPVASVQFATPDEIKVDDLQYNADSSVDVIQDDDGLIIWLDEETL
jgi:hypothetical protein